MQDNEKKPALRFKGFTDPWEQRKLGDITVELSEYATQELGLPLLTSSRSGLMYQDEYRDSRTTKSTETLFSVVPVGTCTYRHMSDDDVFHMNINTLEKGLVSVCILSLKHLRAIILNFWFNILTQVRNSRLFVPNRKKAAREPDCTTIRFVNLPCVFQH